MHYAIVATLDYVRPAERPWLVRSERPLVVRGPGAGSLMWRRGRHRQHQRCTQGSCEGTGAGGGDG